jgi:hypothetical protein
MTTVPRDIRVSEPNPGLEMLRGAAVSRLGMSIADHPDVFLVDFVVDRGTVVFRTAGGTNLAATVLSRAVASEVDGYGPESAVAWSVVGAGDAVGIDRMHDNSGRRFHVVDEPTRGGSRRTPSRASEE